MRQEHCLTETLYVTKQQPLQKSFLFSLFHLQDLLFTMASKHMMGIDNPVQRVGFNVNIFINSQEVYKFICTICKNVLRNAVQIPESNDPKRACLDCYKDNIRYVSSFLTIFCFFPWLHQQATYSHSTEFRLAYDQFFKIMSAILHNSM